MTPDLFRRLLDRHGGLRKEGTVHLVPEDIDFALFVSLQAEVLTVARVARIELADDLVRLETHKGERLLFPIDSVAGARSSVAEKSVGGRTTLGAGFR